MGGCSHFDAPTKASTNYERKSVIFRFPEKSRKIQPCSTSAPLKTTALLGGFLSDPSWPAQKHACLRGSTNRLPTNAPERSRTIRSTHAITTLRLLCSARCWALHSTAGLAAAQLLPPTLHFSCSGCGTLAGRAVHELIRPQAEHHAMLCCSPVQLLQHVCCACM